MGILSRHQFKRIYDALSTKLTGLVSFDDIIRHQYSTAACNYRIFPMGVVFPNGVEDVIHTVRIARENLIPLTARGAGTGFSGGALGSGLILDFSRFMNRITSIDLDHHRIRVEPGVIPGDIDHILASSGYFFPPDPGSKRFCTIGGMVGNNASGTHAIQYGSTRQYITRVHMVLADGKEYQFTNKMNPSPNDVSTHRIINGIDKILTSHLPTITQCLPHTSKNASGYLLRNIRDSQGDINVAALITGSEGTLGLITSMELKILPLPPTKGSLILFFDSMEAAIDAVDPIRTMNPASLEMIGETIFNTVHQSSIRMDIPFPQNFQVLLLVEFHCPTNDEVRSRLSVLENLMVGPGRLARSACRLLEGKKIDQMQVIRNMISPLLYRNASLTPIRFIDDSVVPIENLPRYVKSLMKMLKRFDIEGMLWGHVGEGNLHFLPRMAINRPDFISQMVDLTKGMVDLIKHYNGSLSGEYGDGLVRSPFLPFMMGKAYGVFEELKRLFDVDNLMNPGKIVGANHDPITDNIKLFDLWNIRKTESRLDEPWIVEALKRCSSCGVCRSYCPVFLSTHDSMSSPRSHANLVGRIISSQFDITQGIVTPRDRQYLDLCIACGLCLTECPSGVDIPGIVQIAKQVNNENWGVSLSDRFTASSGIIGYLGSQQPRLSNYLLSNRVFRYLMAHVLKMEQRRGLPGYSEKSHSHKQLTSLRTGRAIVYHPGCFARYHDFHGEGNAVIEILLLHGYFPFIPQIHCCGISQIINGRAESIRKNASDNISTLRDLVKGGMQIITSSPSCGFAFRHEYPILLQTTESVQVSEQILDIHELLINLIGSGKFVTNLKPLQYLIAVHKPCHMRALGVDDLQVNLLRMIPDLQIHVLHTHCCGMSGNYGLQTTNFDLSFVIGEPLFDEIKQIQPELVVSACGKCRMQIEQACGVKTAHPMSILAESYGLIAHQSGLDLKYGKLKK